MNGVAAYSGGMPRGRTFGRIAIPPEPVELPEAARRIDDEAPTWDVLLALYQAFCQASALSSRTIQARISELRLLNRHFGVKPTQIALVHLLAMQNRPISASSKQRNRSVYQMFFRWMHEEGYVEKDVAFRLPKVKVPRRSPRPFSVSQLERMLAAARNRTTRTYMLLGAYQGMRVAEIARVRGEMFDLESNTLRFIAKGGIQRTMDIHPIVRGEIAHYPRHGYWFPAAALSRNGLPHVVSGSVGSAIHLAIRRAGIDTPELTAHSLRHFFATELLNGGTDIRVVQELMGHQQLNSTAIYTLVSNEAQREGLASLPQVTLPGAHFSRRHRRAWVSLAGAAQLLDKTPAEVSRLAQDHAWRYTADDGQLVYAINDVEATGKRIG